MKLRISAGLQRFLVAVLVMIVLATVGAGAYMMPWSLERQLLVVVGTAAGLFLLIIFKLLHSSVPRVQADITAGSLFSELYENSPVPYIRTNGKGEIIHTNAAGVRLLSETRDSVKGKALFDYFEADEETAEHIDRIPQLVRAGSFINDQEVQLRRADGALRWVILSAFPYHGRRESLVTLVDITKQKNVENAKSEFVSLASHQLRTPIASIKWNMELLMSAHVGDLNDKQKKFAEKVARAAERMNMLLNDFLSASKLEMGNFEAKPETIVLDAFVEAQMEEFDARIQSKNITVKRSFTPKELSVSVDPRLLRMVLSNLVSNAIKYTPEGGNVVISYTVADRWVSIEVKDTGLGIPEADQEKLFTKFFRASNTKDNLIEGTGLGLYIVRQAVKRMEGNLSFGSKEGVGTRFIVDIPL